MEYIDKIYYAIRYFKIINKVFSYNLVNIFKNISFPEYYTKFKIIIFVAIIVLMLITLLGTLSYSCYKKNTREIISVIFEGIYNGFFSVIIGVLLNFLNLKIAVAENIEMFIFIAISSLLAVQLFINIFVYYFSFANFLVKMLKYFTYEIILIIILLGANNKLDMYEATEGVILIVIFSLIAKNLEDRWISLYRILDWIKLKLLTSNYDDITICESQREDLAIKSEKELFPSRQRQLKYFISQLQDKGDEPFSVAVSGRWGTGKTSFMNAFKDSVGNCNFVYIEPKLENDMNKMLEDIVEQFYKIFKKEGIYTGKGSVLRNYFDTIIRIIGGKEFSFFTEIFSNLIKEEKFSYYDMKQKLNKEILRLITKKKLITKNNLIEYKLSRIFIVVDDLDRCDEKVKLNTLNFIKEVVDLKGCTVIFLVDYNNLRSEKVTSEFLDKYINNRFELVDINYDEIIRYFDKKDFFLNNKFYDNQCDRIKKIQSEIKANLEQSFIDKIGLLNEILDGYVKENKKIELSDNKINERNKEDIRKRVEVLTKEKDELILNLKNPRKMKRFYRELERTLLLVYYNWFSYDQAESNELTKQNWSDIVFRISFIKVFFEKQFDNLANCLDVNSYKENNFSFVSKILINENLSGRREQEQIVNMILHQSYEINNPTYIKTVEQKINDEFKNKKLNEDNIDMYLSNLKYNFPNRTDYFKDLVVFINNITSTQRSIQASFEVFSFLAEITRAYRENEIIKCVYFAFEQLENKVAKVNRIKINELIYIKNEIIDNFARDIKADIIALIQLTDLKGFSYEKLNETYFRNNPNLNVLYNNLVNFNNHKTIYEFNNTKPKIEEIRNFLNILKDKLYSSKELEDVKEIINYYYGIAIQKTNIMDFLSSHDDLTIEVEYNEVNFNTEFYVQEDELEVKVKQAINNIKRYIKINEEKIESYDVYRYFGSICQVIEILYPNIELKPFKEYDLYKELNSIYEELTKKLSDNNLYHLEWWKYNKIRLLRIKNLVDN